MRAKIIRGAVNAGEDRTVGAASAPAQGGKLVRSAGRDVGGRFVRDGLPASEQQHSDVLQAARSGSEVSSAGLLTERSGQAHTMDRVTDSIAKPRTADSVIRNWCRWWCEQHTGSPIPAAKQHFRVPAETIRAALDDSNPVRGTKAGSWGGVSVRLKTRLD